MRFIRYLPRLPTALNIPGGRLTAESLLERCAIMNPGTDIRLPRPPVPVLVVAGMYLAVGIIGFVAHVHDLLATPSAGIWVELTELLAAIAGVFLLRGRNWARWLAVAWITFHVILSAFASIRELAMHAILAVLIVSLLFLPSTTRWFQSPRTELV
jgi:hypothetical protein